MGSVVRSVGAGVRGFGFGVSVPGLIFLGGLCVLRVETCFGLAGRRVQV